MLWIDSETAKLYSLHAWPITIDIIPIAITLLYTYITWQKNTRVIRYGVIFAAIIWIYYNFSVQAYITIIGNILEILSGFIAEFNIKKEKK